MKKKIHIFHTFCFELFSLNSFNTSMLFELMLFFLQTNTVPSTVICLISVHQNYTVAN